MVPHVPSSSIAVSLALHALLLGVAAFGSSPSPPLQPRTSALRSLEGRISVDAAGLAGPAHEPAPPQGEAARPAAPASDAAPTPVRKAPRVPRAQPAPRPEPPPSPAPVEDTTPSAAVAAKEPFTPAPAPATSSTAPEARQASASGAPSAVATGPVAPGAAGAVPGSAAGGLGGGGAGVTGSAQGATGALSTEARGQLLARYLKGVRDRVEQHREYPYLARRANLEGTICLRVSVGANGQVLAVTPTCGHTHLPLLKAALQSVSSAAPFPPIPAALGPRLTLDVPVVFELDRL